MALIVEDGTGRADAEALISVAGATAYHTARGNAAWAALASDTVREQLLRKAADYIEQVYRDRWTGYRVNTTQALSWPRYVVPVRDSASMNYGGHSYYASNAVPPIVANACAELALKASAHELAADTGPQKVHTKVGQIEVDYLPGASQVLTYHAIDGMLAPFLKGGGGSVIAVVRA